MNDHHPLRRHQRPGSASGLPSLLLLLSLSLTSIGAMPTTATEPPVADPNAGQTAWRWIGLRSGDQTHCPPPAPDSGWSVAPLFGETPNPTLARFCLYQHPDGGNPRALARLGLARLDPDVLGVAPQGSALADATWETLRDHFLAQAGQVALPAGPRVATRLTVLDASPSGEATGASGPEDVAANSPHGTALLNMARDLLCDATETSCRAQLASRLTMAWRCFDHAEPGRCRDAASGGYVGLIGELAQAIHHEVALRPRPKHENLILNLSLGWHQGLGGGESRVENMPTPAMAVYRALEDAVCRGALPIVAAGNHEAAIADVPGPFLPALWETRPAPTPATCRRLGIRTTAGASPYRPLVFSVAGVDDAGASLSTTRASGVAPLAAFADHAVVAFSNTATPTGTLTGSSVASLVVATSAAAVWSYRPALDAFAIMEILYQGGTDLGRLPDYCLGGGCSGRSVRQIRLCESVAEACAAGPCAAPVCQAPPRFDLASVDLSAFDDVAVVDMTDVDDPQAGVPACGPEILYWDDTTPTPTFSCPHRQLDGPSLVPWTEPQPQSIPCPNCIATHGSPGILSIEIDDAWQGRLTDATLHCDGVSYALDLGTLAAGDQWRVTEVPETCLTGYPTFLSFVHRGTRAVLSPIRVCEDCAPDE